MTRVGDVNRLFVVVQGEFDDANKESHKRVVLLTTSVDRNPHLDAVKYRRWRINIILRRWIGGEV